MIVDIHTHCMQPDHVSEAGKAADERAGYPPMQPLHPDTYLEGMAPVDKAIVFGIRAYATGVESPNSFTAEWVANAPDKLIGFMAIDPVDQGCLDEIDRGLELGLRGIKIYPMLGRYNPADPTIFAVYEKAQRLRLPIISHFGASPNPRAMLKFSHPLLVDEIAQAFPDLKFVIAHMAHPWQRDCALVLRKHPNVYADVSGSGWVRPWQAWEAFVLMQEWGVTDKLLFGSDFPGWSPQEGMDKMRRLNEQVEGTNLPRIREDVIEGIIHRNSLELLGLE
jgi:hypothetical protein